MSDKYTSADYQNAVRQMVDREVHYCVSQLVYELAQKFEHFPEWEEELLGAFQGYIDFEEAARDHGWRKDGDGDFVNVDFDDAKPHTDADDWQELCELERIDAEDYAPDVFEHWIVSPWLARKLEQHGEKVFDDFFGLTVWCRCTTGQAILLDRVICDIYDESQRRVA